MEASVDKCYSDCCYTVASDTDWVGLVYNHCYCFDSSSKVVTAGSASVPCCSSRFPHCHFVVGADSGRLVSCKSDKRLERCLSLVTYQGAEVLQRSFV